MYKWLEKGRRSLLATTTNQLSRSRKDIQEIHTKVSARFPPVRILRILFL